MPWEPDSVNIGVEDSGGPMARELRCLCAGRGVSERAGVDEPVLEPVEPSCSRCTRRAAADGGCWDTTGAGAAEAALRLRTTRLACD